MNPTVISALQAALVVHWTAIETYTGQAAHFLRNGYPLLAGKAKEDAEEERGHAAKLLARLEFWDQSPIYTHSSPNWPRLPDFNGILAANLQLENDAAAIERAGILTARAAGDERTAEILADNLKGSEEAIEAITAAQRLIVAIGLDNYLANQA